MIIFQIHKHPKHDEIFYYIKEKSFWILEGNKVGLTVGKALIVPADTLHSMESDAS
jgi:quercetin dioxygenase-like cupin family protein